MEKIIEDIISQDKKCHEGYSIFGIKLKINSKNELIVCHMFNIFFYSLNNLELKNKISFSNIIIDFIILENDSLICIDHLSNLILLERTNDYTYIKKKQEKLIEKKDIGIRYIINLNEKNIICAFILNNIYIIDIISFTILSTFVFDSNIDPRTKPFLISAKKNLICFRTHQEIYIINYKTMKIKNKLKLDNNIGFQLYKNENLNEDFIYVLSIIYLIGNDKKSKSGSEDLVCHVEIIKLDLDLKLIDKEKYVMKIGENEDIKYYDYDHSCIYRCIIENLKNFKFILHEYHFPPYEIEWFCYLECIDGNIEELPEILSKSNCLLENSHYDYALLKIGDEIITAYGEMKKDKKIKMKYLSKEINKPLEYKLIQLREKRPRSYSDKTIDRKNQENLINFSDVTP